MPLKQHCIEGCRRLTVEPIAGRLPFLPMHRQRLACTFRLNGDPAKNTGDATRSRLEFKSLCEDLCVLCG